MNVNSENRNPLQLFAFICLFNLIVAGVCQADGIGDVGDQPQPLVQSNVSSPRGKPNIVLIMADDLGYECLGCNGGLSYQTPNLDRLASAGIRFTNCHSQPLCTPTRVQIMTGKYNFRNYVNFEYLDPTQQTMGQLLKKSGYATCIAGKWQLNGRGWKKPGRQNVNRPQESGFDESCLWQVTGLGKRYRNPVLELNGKRKEFPDAYGPDVCVEFISEFVERKKSEPFFVYYPMILPHAPFVPTPDSKDWGQEKPAGSSQQYFGEMVAYTDKLVGRIEQMLKDQGVHENTIFIFTGDNGTTRGLTTRTKAGDVPGAKGMTIDAGTHVPMIVSWPERGIKAKVVSDLIDFTDVLPTLVEAAGGSLPTDTVFDGTSFLPQLKGEKGNPREYIYCFYDPVHSNNVNRYRNRLARNHRFKVYHDGKSFDVKKDPFEERPLERKSLSESEQKELAFLDSVVERFEQQGAAEAAKRLAQKTRPGAKPRKQKNKKSAKSK